MQALPVIYVTADNYYDVGKVIGTTFRGYIADYINKSKDVELYRQFYHSSEGRKIYEMYVKNSEQNFKEVLDEIRGISDGADQTFIDIFLLQLASEIRHCHRHEIPEINVTPPIEDKGCTDILINTKDLRMIAHNDDWSDEVSELVYVCHVTITTKERDQTIVKEKFMSYMYPGHLPGFCFGMNADLVMSLNTLRPVTANRSGIPLAIVLRKLLSCASIEECSAVLENKPIGCAYGANINIAHINDDAMCSLETYQEESMTRVSILKVLDSHYVHTNHYQHTKDATEKPANGSYLRHQRAEEMMSHNPTCFDGVRRVLGDTRDDNEPIYRIPSEKHLLPHSKTSATAMFDLTNRRMHIYRSNPHLERQPCFSMDLI